MNIEIQNIKITTLRNAIRQQFERYFLYSFSNIRNETISTYYQYFTQGKKKKEKFMHEIYEIYSSINSTRTHTLYTVH